MTMKNVLILIFVLAALFSKQLIADDISGGPRVNLLTGQLIIPCLKVSDAGSVFDGRYFDVKLGQIGNSFDFVFGEKEDDEVCKKLIEASLNADENTSDVNGVLGSSNDTQAPPSLIPGKVIIFNNCALPVKLMAVNTPAIDGDVLEHLGKKVLDLKTDLNGGDANAFLAAPMTTASQCNAINCQNWNDISNDPLPPAANMKQRTGSMYEGDNLTFGAYCQPTNAAANQCTPGANTPCCGPKMTFDKTFGTQWEITPFGNTDGNQDSLDLTTNYGTGPNSPPSLCPPNEPDPNQNCKDKVTASQNIFYNIPIAIEIGGGACACGDLGMRSAIECTDISCADAFQHPEDPKLCICSSYSAQVDRGYVITYCPTGSPLPPLPKI